MKEIIKLPPFKRFCMTIGNLPSSYVESLTYAELLYWFCDYLQNKVIPTIDNNAQAVQELQGLFTQLQNYVNSYFENLDVQAEVDNKLDEMVQDGTFDELINQHLLADINSNLNLLLNHNSIFITNIIKGINQNVLFTGDSITYGEHPTTEAQVENPYPRLLETFVNNWYGENRITCLNYGVRGAKSINANNNFNNYLAENPSTIFWAYGTNDITQNVPIDDIINNLQNFYKNCVANNIELIVLIPSPNFVNASRRQGMMNLHVNLLNYCKKMGLLYVDMFEYINKIYDTLSNQHINLQTDNTHFIDYKCFADAIISKLLPNVYVQNNEKINHIQIDSANYVKTNIGSVNVGGGVNPFQNALRITNAENNNFEMNIEVNSPSILKFIGFRNSTAGKIRLLVDGEPYEIDEYLSSVVGVNNKNSLWEYRIPVVLKNGIHNISLLDVTFIGEQNRFYMFGFNLEKIDDFYFSSIQGKKQITLWEGEETYLEDEPFLQDISNYNELIFVIGRNDKTLQQIRINPVEINRNFYENNPFAFPVVYNNTVSIANINIRKLSNSFEFSTSAENIPLRKVYGVNNINNKKYIPFLNSEYLNNIGIL